MRSPLAARTYSQHVLTTKKLGQETVPPGSPGSPVPPGSPGSAWEPLAKFEDVSFSLKIQEICISQGAPAPQEAQGPPQTILIHLVWGLVARIT